jgi:large repetitive protein
VNVTGVDVTAQDFDAAKKPGAPRGVAAKAGDAQVTVSFKAPTSNGGSPITAYTVTSSPGHITVHGAGSPITVTGLTNGTAYTFTAKATNAAGTGPASIKSNKVTPKVAAAIMVTTPQGGETWQRGKKYTISWNYTGNPGTTVMIALVERTSSSPIKASTSIGANGQGSYSWTIPKKHATGSDYKVRITSKTKPSFTATSNGTFTIN